MSDYVEVESVVERHGPGVPRYVTFARDRLAPLQLSSRTVTIEGFLNGVDLGRRGLKPWDPRYPRVWFFDIPQHVCRKAGVDTGDTVYIRIRRASEELPPELSDLIEGSQVARERWNRLTAGQQRRLREDVLAAKSSEARLRRARKALVEGCD